MIIQEGYTQNTLMPKHNHTQISGYFIYSIIIFGMSGDSGYEALQILGFKIIIVADSLANPQVLTKIIKDFLRGYVQVAHPPPLVC